jgi:hypothetical protein
MGGGGGAMPPPRGAPQPPRRTSSRDTSALKGALAVIAAGDSDGGLQSPPESARKSRATRAKEAPIINRDHRVQISGAFEARGSTFDGRKTEDKSWCANLADALGLEYAYQGG